MRWVAAWCLSSCALLAAAAHEVAGAGAELGHLGLVALPWLALAGAPRGAARAPRRGEGWLALSLAAPALAVAARLDLARGASAPRAAAAALGAVLAAALLRLAARGGAVTFAPAWLLAVALPPVVARLPDLAPPAWLAAAAAASPLELALRLALGEAVTPGAASAALATCALLLALARVGRAPREAAR